MDIFEKNLKFLKKFQPDLHKRITQTPDAELETDITYEKKGANYLAVSNDIRCFIQSRYSTSDELKSMFSGVPKTAKQIILFGIALGKSSQYTLNRENFPVLKSLIIVEPSLKWFKTAMAEVDFEELWQGNLDKITLIAACPCEVSGNQIADKIISLKDSGFLVYHLPTRVLFEKHYRQILDSVEIKVRTKRMLIETEADFFYMKIHNAILNSAVPACNFEDIMDIFKGKNVIIVSAGPSLEKNITLLPEAKKKAIVIAVGTAIRILDERGIIPHFRMAVERLPKQVKIFGNLKNDKIPLIYNDPFYHGILPSYTGKIIRMITTEDNFGKLVRKLKNLKTVPILSGASVVNIAAALVCQSCCKRLVFIGQDMCMYDYKIHTGADEAAEYKKMAKKEDNFILKLKDIYGADVISPINYYTIKKLLEELAEIFGNMIEFINATEGGLGIKSVPNRSLSEVLASWEENDPQPVIDEWLEKTPVTHFKDQLEKFQKSLVKIDSLNSKTLLMMQEIKDSLAKNDILTDRNKFIAAFKETREITLRLKEIDWYSQCVELEIADVLDAVYQYWQGGLESAEELVKFRSISELQLQMARLVKNYTFAANQALKEVLKP